MSADFGRILRELDEARDEAQRIASASASGADAQNRARRVVRALDDVERMVRDAESEYRRERRRDE